MSNQSLGIGGSANDGTGDTLRAAADKVNDNFSEIYTLIGDGTTLTTGISSTGSVVTLTAPLITTSIVPTTADGASLGTSAAEFSDLFLADAAVINLGSDQDVTLTHVADTGVLLNSTSQLQFGDSGTYIHQSADGVLDLVSDTEIEINATTIDVNGNLDVSGTIVGAGALTAATSITVGSAVLTEAELETLDGITAGTVLASKVIITDSDKDITGGRNITISGELDAATGDFSGDVDVDGTLEADAITIGGVTLAETISDTVGAMVTSNTETGITVSYDDGDNTLDFVIGTLNQNTTGSAATLTTARTIGGTSFDGSANIAVGLAGTATALAAARTIGGTSFDGTANIAVGLAATATTLETARTIGGVSFNGSANIDLPGVNAAGNQATSGLAGTATALATARTIGGTSFDGTGDIVVALASVGTAVTVADESSDTTCFPLFTTAATGDLPPKSGTNLTFNSSSGLLTATSFAGALTGNVTGNASGTAATVTGAAQTNITSVGTLTALQVDNININTNTISTTAGTDLLITPVAGQQIVLDGTIVIDAGVVTGATSITSTAFVGDITGDVTGTADVATVATTVTITDNESTNENNAIIFTAGGDVDGGNIGLESDGTLTYNPSTGKITATGFVGTLTGNVTGNLAGTVSTATQNSITTATGLVSVGALDSGSITSGFTSIDVGSGAITTTGLISGGSLDIDNVLINGTTIGHTDDTDLITLADGVVTVAGEISVTTLDIGGANVTATAAELNILDASAGNTAVASDVSSSAGAITSNNFKISHTLTLAAELADDAEHADVVITSDKCLATSTVIANASIDAHVDIHTVVAGSFKVRITNKSGGALANDSTMVLNYTII